MNMFEAKDIRQLRESLKLSLTAFAARLGVSYGTVVSWESGRRHPRYSHLVELNKLAAQTRFKLPSQS
jgi:DNA-binding transcriptional regulator YiaG